MIIQHVFAPLWARPVRVSLALVGFAIGLTTAAGCGPPSELSELPEEVHGEWTTGSAEYAERAFRLSAHELTIVVDAKTEYTHAIERVQVQERNGRPFYVVHHRNRDGIDDTFRIEYAEYPTRFIRIENLDRVHWTRESDRVEEAASAT